MYMMQHACGMIGYSAISMWQACQKVNRPVLEACFFIIQDCQLRTGNLKSYRKPVRQTCHNAVICQQVLDTGMIQAFHKLYRQACDWYVNCLFFIKVGQKPSPSIFMDIKNQSYMARPLIFCFHSCMCTHKKKKAWPIDHLKQGEAGVLKFKI